MFRACIFAGSLVLATAGCSRQVAGDIDGDGTDEFFRTCFSNEGVHFQAWTGTPLEGRGRWLWYYDAGYALDYNCTEQEYFGPK